MIPPLMPQCLFWKPKRVFKYNFCSLRLLMMLKEVTFWHSWEKPAIYLIHFSLLLVNNHCSKIISTAKSALCLGYYYIQQSYRNVGSNTGLAYQLKSMKCEQKQISPDLKALSSNFCLFSIAPFIYFNKRFQTVGQIIIMERQNAALASFPMF